jgi:SAM-dependent methyltransferase
VRQDDPRVVREEYTTETRLAARKAAHILGEGPDARHIAFGAVAEGQPSRVLEVGPGEGELAGRIQRELGCDVVAIDQSERMIELTRDRGIDARLGDVRDLPFDDAEFDCAVAAWMLYHVAEIDVALGELARVLRPNGRLVTVTNGRNHLQELKDLLGVTRAASTFDAEDADRLLSNHFSHVEKRDAAGWLVFPSRAEAQHYVDSTVIFAGRRLPPFDGPFKVRRAPVVFVAHKT